MGASMETDMRADLFKQFSRLSFSYHDNNKSGEMASKILTDLFDISELAHHGPENIFICTLKIIGSFVLLFMINIPLTLMMMVATVIMASYSVYTNYKRRVVFTSNRQRMGQMNSQITDSLGGIKTVQSFGNENYEIAKFREINNRYLETKRQSYKFIANFIGANSLFQGVLYTVTLVGGGYCVANNLIAANELAIFAIYIAIFLNPIQTLIEFSETFQKGYAGFKRFEEIMNVDPDVKDKPNAIKLHDDIAPSISFTDVSFTYKNDTHKKIAIKDLNLKIKAGEKIAFVGPSGEGKSTICSLIPRFYDVDTGEILIGDNNVKDYTIESLRKSIGIVQQDVYLFDTTIAENISYGLKDVSKYEIVRAAKLANIHDFICTLPNAYETKTGERGGRLSGGQKQRIAIARLFLRNPKIVILDEATSALDNESEATVQASLENLCKDRTTIVIAHRLSTIKMVDRIAVVNHGKIAEVGTHDELMKNKSLYFKYHNLQFNK